MSPSCDAGTMSADSSAFARLPLAVQDSLLQQAFQQLDQRHLYGVVPRVCQLFHQLSLSNVSSLDVTVTTGAKAELFSLWMQKHGSRLDSLVLTVNEPGRLVQHSIAAAEQLRSLTLTCSTPWDRVTLDAPLHSLTKLTKLSIDGFYNPTTPVLNSILGLKGLNSLTLRGVFELSNGFMHQLSIRLVKLTYLDLRGSRVGLPALISLRSLPDLKELLVWRAFRGVDLLQLDTLPLTSVAVALEGTTQADLTVWLRNAAGCLQCLKFIGGTESTALALHELPLHQVAQLESLRMYDVELSAVHASISALAQLTQLTSLDLYQCGLDDAAVCKLSVLSNLRHLGLKGNGDISGAQGSMEVLARSMPQLKKLELHGTSAHEAALMAFGAELVS